MMTTKKIYQNVTAVQNAKVCNIIENGVVFNQEDLKDFVAWMQKRVNTKNRNTKLILDVQVKTILDEIKAEKIEIAQRDIDYLVQYAENAAPDFNIFYKTVRAVFRRANCIAA